MTLSWPECSFIRSHAHAAIAEACENMATIVEPSGFWAISSPWSYSAYNVSIVEKRTPFCWIFSFHTPESLWKITVRLSLPARLARTQSQSRKRTITLKTAWCGTSIVSIAGTGSRNCFPRTSRFCATLHWNAFAVLGGNSCRFDAPQTSYFRHQHSISRQSGHSGIYWDHIPIKEASLSDYR